MTAVPFNDLGAQYRSIKDEIDAAIQDVLDNTSFVLGPAVAGFESAFASYCGTRHAVAVSSGTAALQLALLAAGIGPGDEVITTAMTFFSTAAAIRHVGATPVLVDIDRATRNIDPDLVEAAITDQTRAILPVHLHGLMADMARISAIADKHDLIVIEDAAQAHGAEQNGRRAGAFGRLGCFSFYPGKNLGAYGEAGAIVTDDDALADSLRIYRDCGQSRKYEHVVDGFNYRMDGIQGAVLGVKLRHLESWTEGRRRCASLFGEKLAARPVECPVEPEGFRHVYHVYAVCADRRDDIRSAMEKSGIATGMHYPTPLHLQPALRDLGYGEDAFPIAERFAQRTLSLPIFSEMSESQIDLCCSALSEALDTASESV